MAVTITDIGFSFKPILATSPMIPDNRYKPNKVIHEWLFAAQGVGDGSGGTVSCVVNFGASFDRNHYIVVTNIMTAHGTSIVYFSSETDRWDNTYFPGHANESIIYWLASSQNYGIERDDQLVKPLYLGRPRLQDGNPGQCSFVWATNNDTIAYNCIIQGYTLERPLPFTSILQP